MFHLVGGQSCVDLSERQQSYCGPEYLQPLFLLTEARTESRTSGTPGQGRIVVFHFPCLPMGPVATSCRMASVLPVLTPSAFWGTGRQRRVSVSLHPRDVGLSSPDHSQWWSPVLVFSALTRATGGRNRPRSTGTRWRLKLSFTLTLVPPKGTLTSTSKTWNLRTSCLQRLLTSRRVLWIQGRG